jgi:hypothetical protein
MLEPGAASTTVEDWRDETCVPPHYMKESADMRAGKNNLFFINVADPGCLSWIPDPVVKKA